MSIGSVAGVDIGGTSFRLVVEDEAGREIARHLGRLDHSAGPEAILASSVVSVAAATDDGLAALGIAVSGPIDVETGIVDNPWTLSGWRGVDVRTPFARFAVPVVVENDANAAAIGEWARGSGRDTLSLAAITIGTGIGVGLVVNGDVFRGAGGSHPEAGHHSIADDGPACYCGRVGCWEQLACGPALTRAAGRPAEEVLQSALAGVQPDLRLVENLARHIGQGLRNVESFYGPEMIVLGGGVGSRLEWVRSSVEEGWGSPSPMAPRPLLTFAQLDDFSGAIGAAFLARRALDLA